MALEVQEDLPFQRRIWAIQRIARALLPVVVLAALLGMFGPGPISHSLARSPDGALTVRYLRFVRAGGTADAEIEADGSLVQNGQLALSIDANLLSEFEIERITPEPAEVLAGDEEGIFRFAVAGQPPRVTISFSLRPQGMGPAGGMVAVPDGPAVPVTHFIYP